MSLDVIKSGVAKPAPDHLENVRLRHATLADAAALALTGAATFLEAFTWMLPGADIVAHTLKNHTAEAYARYLDEPRTRITVAVTGAPVVFPNEPGSIVGYAMLCDPELPSIDLFPGDIELKRIYLFSRFRAAPVLGANGEVIPGVRPGQALMDAAVAEARDLGAKRLLLGTHAENVRAIAFYQRNGFGQVGARIFQVGSQQCCDLILAKAL